MSNDNTLSNPPKWARSQRLGAVWHLVKTCKLYNSDWMTYDVRTSCNLEIWDAIVADIPWPEGPFCKRPTCRTEVVD